MKNTYQVTIRGVRLESADLKQLLARAVAEKRSMDAKIRHLWYSRTSALLGYEGMPATAE